MSHIYIFYTDVKLASRDQERARVEVDIRHWRRAVRIAAERTAASGSKAPAPPDVSNAAPVATASAAAPSAPAAPAKAGAENLDEYPRMAAASDLVVPLDGSLPSKMLFALVDFCDTRGVTPQWFAAHIDAARYDDDRKSWELLVHLLGWSSVVDVWIQAADVANRISTFGAHTNGAWTGARPIAQT